MFSQIPIFILTSSSFPGETLTEPMRSVAGQFYNMNIWTHCKYFSKKKQLHSILISFRDRWRFPNFLEIGTEFISLQLSRRIFKTTPPQITLQCASCCYCCHILPRKRWFPPISWKLGISDCICVSEKCMKLKKLKDFILPSWNIDTE